MPELPEVETIARGLRKAIVGKKVKDVQAIFPGIIRQNFNYFKKAVTQRTIKRVRRRGKYLLLDLTGGKTILLHLGMTGNLLFNVRRPLSTVRRRLQTTNSGRIVKLTDLSINSSTTPPQSSRNNRHDHLIFIFCGSNDRLCYNDQRKFGKIKVYNTTDEKNVPELNKLGPKALEITSSQFVNIFKRRKGKIKSALLNQHIMAGLGNIYADESLFEAKINPVQKGDRLSENRLKQLHKAIKKILLIAIKAGGSSIDNYLNVNGKMGEFQLQHKAYGREGERCKRCGARIKRIKIIQRSSYFCPRCQPLKD